MNIVQSLFDLLSAHSGFKQFRSKLVNSRMFGYECFRNLYFRLSGFRVSAGAVEGDWFGQSRFFYSDRRNASNFASGFIWRDVDLSESFLFDTWSRSAGGNFVFIDCGANQGDFLFSIMQRFNRCCGYVGMEPDPIAYDLLCRNLSGFNVVDQDYPMLCLPVALGDFDGVSTFYLAEGSADSSVLENVLQSGLLRDVMKVPVRRLDTLLPELLCDREGYALPLVLKVEAQGFELQVLRGALGILKHTKFILLDGAAETKVGGEATLTECVSFLIPLGFKVVATKIQGRYIGRCVLQNERY